MTSAAKTRASSPAHRGRSSWSGRGRRWLWRTLVDQRLGIVCSWAAAGLLGVGSLWMDRRPELYAGLRLDDVRFFFSPWRWEHGWFYLAAFALGLWGLSTFACVVRSVSDRVARRVTRLSAFGAPIVHSTFLLALIAHLWGGLAAHGSEHVVGSSEGVRVGAATLRAVSVQEQLSPNGMPRQARAVVERERAGGIERLEIAYNEPITSEWGTEELLLVRHGERPQRAQLVHRGVEVELEPGVPTDVAGDRLTLRAIHDRGGGRGLRVPVADLWVGEQRVLVPLGDRQAAGEAHARDSVGPRTTAGHPGGAAVPGQGAAASSSTQFVGVVRGPVLLLTARTNPSVPLVGVMALLLAVGVVLVVQERRWRLRSRAGHPRRRASPRA